MNEIITRSFAGWIMLAEYRGAVETLWIQYDSQKVTQTGSAPMQIAG